MAAIGDVLVKFVADFAEFSANMGKSQKDIESWAKSIAEAGKSVQGFINLATRVGGALALGEAIRQVVEFNNQMQKQGETLVALALRTDAASRSVRGLTDDSVKLAEMYKTTGREWTDDYLARVQKAQDSSEDFSNKSFVLGQRLHNLYLQLTQRPGDGGGLIQWASDQGNALFDQMEKLVPAVNSVVDALGRGLVIQLVATANGIRLVVEAAKEAADWFGRMARAATVSQGALEQMGREQAKARGYNIPAPTGPTGAGGAFGMFDGTSGSQTAAEAARQYQDTQRQLGRGFGSILGVPISLAAADNAPPAAAGGRGGGGGTSDADSVQAQIARYSGLQKAAQSAYDTISKGAGQNIEDLQRQVKVQQQVDEIVAKLIAKHQQVDDVQKKALYDAVSGYEQERAAADKLLAVNQAAVETDKKYGDGKVSLAKQQKDLNDQLKTGRITQEDYNRATVEGTEAITQAALAAKRYDDNMGSLTAGFAHAANAYSRSNDLYSLGEQSFNAVTSSMTEGLKALEGQSSKTFGQIALDFANMLAQMALQAAASQAFKLLLGSLGGVSSVPVVGSGGFGSMAGVNTANAAAGLPLIPGLAGGGPVSAGKPYMVGEKGPEYFVPDAAGKIVPMSQTGGGGSVNVNVDMSGGGSGQMSTQDGVTFGRKVKEAVVGVIANEQRPGGSLYMRKSA